MVAGDAVYTSLNGIDQQAALQGGSGHPPREIQFWRERPFAVLVGNELHAAQLAVLLDDPLLGHDQRLGLRGQAAVVARVVERVDLATAIRMHTLNGAYAAFEEGEKGSLEPGKLADLVLLGENLTRVPTARLRHVEVAMTVVGGEIVHQA